MTIRRRMRTYWALGPRSLARVGLYRAGLRLGLHPVQRLQSAPATGPFFRAERQARDLPGADSRWLDHVVRFDWHEEPLPAGACPDWFANPWGRHGGTRTTHPWWTIGDFGSGDIKGLWELSRFGWACALAGCAARRQPGAAERLNAWLADWTARNPPYHGPNWKCGQEASIRVMHLAAAAVALNEDNAPLPGVLALVAQHLQRVAPTLGYALGQDNNHGTSEAAALFIGGSWLEAAGDPRGARWAATGRRWLEERACRLIFADGSFSQYSITYHRVMLDSYALAEAWRARRGLPEFSPALRARLVAATRWLRAMVDPASGDAPNIGASDGTRLLPFSATGYRDFRPSVELAGRLFCQETTYPGQAPASLAGWLNVALPSAQGAPAVPATCAEGGWLVLRTKRAHAVLRFPRFRYRPGHADALHLDLCVDGRNLLRDAGTYSYNDPAVPDGDFAGTRFHNTVTFDDADQMPRLGRFLYGDWLAPTAVEPVRTDAGFQTAAAGYCDTRGNRHHRQVRLSDTTLTCIDTIGGSFGRATLRWRLPPGHWTIDNARVSGDGLDLSIDADGATAQIALVDDVEAREYLRQSPVCVLEVTVDRPCTITTRGSF